MGWKTQFRPMGFGFIADYTFIAGMKPIRVRVERKVGVPF